MSAIDRKFLANVHTTMKKKRYIYNKRDIYVHIIIYNICHAHYWCSIVDCYLTAELTVFFKGFFSINVFLEQAYNYTTEAYSIQQYIRSQKLSCHLHKIKLYCLPTVTLVILHSHSVKGKL